MATFVPGSAHNALLQQRIVAFLDILGFQDLMHRMDGAEPELADRVHHCLAGAHAKEAGIYESTTRRVEMTSFSDCTVISGSLDDAVEVLGKAAYLTRDFVIHGILSRGAVVVGKAYHQERILFGPAVVFAYDAERNVAKYPRIYVADEIANVVRADPRASAGRYHVAQALRRDSDGCWFLDVFLAALAGNPGGRQQQFLSIRHHLESDLHRALRGRRTDIVAKYRWLIARFNETVPQHFAGLVRPIDIDPQL